MKRCPTFRFTRAPVRLYRLNRTVILYLAREKMGDGLGTRGAVDDVEQRCFHVYYSLPNVRISRSTRDRSGSKLPESDFKMNALISTEDAFLTRRGSSS